MTDPSLQEQSRLWWEQNPMCYDWKGSLVFPEGSPEFYMEIDRRFLRSSPFYKGKIPFEKWIPFASLRGKRVLEIGCGAGSHAQLMAQAGCRLTAIDLSPKAVELTRKRFSLRGLTAQILCMDAGGMAFGNAEFDFVWSWGVVHHSVHPERILKEVFRVLRPGGEFRMMVYHRRSLCAFFNIVRGLLSGKVFRGMSFDEILSHYSDGYMARFYSAGEASRLLQRQGFLVSSVRILGQKSELIPLPARGIFSRFKERLLSWLPDGLAQSVLARGGSFLFCIAQKSNPSPGAPLYVR